MYKKLDFEEKNLSKLNISDLKKVADYSLRKYLLSKQNTNKVYCPLKKQWFSRDRVHVAHFIDRGKSMWTRYDLMNCHLISATSNTFDAQVPCEGYKSKHHREYELWLIEEYGDGIIERLNVEAERKDLFLRKDYLEVIKKFRD
jgi:hypothetical protein